MIHFKINVTFIHIPIKNQVFIIHTIILQSNLQTSANKFPNKFISL